MNNDLYTLYAAENHIMPIKKQEIIEKKVQETPKKEEKSKEDKIEEDKIEEDIKPLID